jgi:hypothetical protein
MEKYLQCQFNTFSYPQIVDLNPEPLGMGHKMNWRTCKNIYCSFNSSCSKMTDMGIRMRGE